MSSGRILHTGQAIVDILLSVTAMPPVGGDIYAHDSSMTAGGGFNMMAAAARDGGKVLYLGTRGTGPLGQIVAEALQREGITSLATPRLDSDTGYCLAITDDTAERTFISVLGAEQHVTHDMLHASDPTPDDVVYISGYSLLHDHNRDAILRWVPQLPDGTRTIFDPSPLIADIPDTVFTAMANQVWLWTMNLSEARHVAARFTEELTPSTSTLEEAHHLATVLTAHLPGPVIVRCGPHGAILTQPNSITHIPGIPVRAIDTNGAGDTHTGVLAAHLARGGSLTDGTRRANVAAAISVTQRGPATSPQSADINAALATGS